MSLAHNLQVIPAMTDLEAIKVKRSGHRGQFTQIKKRPNALIRDRELPSINQMDLDDLLSLCKETKSLHDALQQQFDDYRMQTSVSLRMTQKKRSIRMKTVSCQQMTSYVVLLPSATELDSCAKVLHFKLL